MKWISLSICVLWVICASVAWGQNCRVFTVPLTFGIYDSFSGVPLNGTGKVNVTCDEGLPFTVKLDQGADSGGNFQPRIMRIPVGKDKIQYNLYRDSACQEIWGNGIGNTFVVTGTGTGREIPFTVYGRIPARQNVPAGYYSVRVNVTVEW